MEDNNKNRNDRILDEIFAIAVDEYEEELLNQIPVDEDIEYEFSEDFNKKHERMLKQYRAGKYKNYRSPAIKVATVIGLLVILSATVTLSIEAVRLKVFNFVIEKADEFAVINVREKNMENEAKQLSLEHLPAGFELITEETEGDVFTVVYANDDKYINYSFWNISIKSAVDTENAEFKEIEILKTKVILSDKGDFNIFTWHDECFVYTIVSNLSQSSVQEIIENFLQN